MNLSQKELAKHLARELRKNQTQAENIFWELVRDRRFYNKKFYRQKVLYYQNLDLKKFFIADFYNHEEKLVVEIDGKIHLYQKDYDSARNELIKVLNIKVVRFSNEQVLNEIETIKIKLIESLKINDNNKSLSFKEGDLG